MSGTTSHFLHDLQEADVEVQTRAQYELWQRGYEAMVGLARRLLSPQDAEEVASTAFLHVFQNVQQRPDIRQMRSSDFWNLLRAVTRNEARSRLRFNRRKKRVGVSYLPSENLQQHPVPSLPLTEAEKEQSALDRFLLFLDELREDPQLRDVAFLRYGKQADPAAIAGELGISKATVYRRLYRIRKAGTLFAQRQRRETI